MKKPKDPGYELTREHVEFFWQCLFAWQQRLGLTDWRITRSDMPPNGKTLCEVRDWDFPQRQVSCRLNTNWFTQEPTETAIEQTAVHELLHVLLADVIEYGFTAGAERDSMRTIEHAAINRLERLLVPGEEGT